MHTQTHTHTFTLDDHSRCTHTHTHTHTLTLNLTLTHTHTHTHTNCGSVMSLRATFLFDTKQSNEAFCHYVIIHYVPSNTRYKHTRWLELLIFGAVCSL